MTWKSTFQPDSNQKDLVEVREAFLSQRYTLGLESLKQCERIVRAKKGSVVNSGLISALTQRSESTTELYEDPAFVIWLRFLYRAAVNGHDEEVLYHYANLPSVLAGAEKRLNNGEKTYMPGSRIPVQRDELDPYIMAVTPPTYNFLKAKQSGCEASSCGHPIGLQAELLGMALKAIGDTWSELKEQVLEVVKIIGYLPDATFRSCSAARYPSVVYLGNMDESVLDIEESLVHEAGHQVLYRLAEVIPLTKPNIPQEATYVLPWSGSRRDLFGFLHAFYIYVLLAKYYWRRASLGDYTSEDCRKRASLIVLGARLAKPMLQANPDLSEQGQIIVEKLFADIESQQETVKI